jgi:putative oxidoreductase
MIYQFAIGIAIALLAASDVSPNLPAIGPHLLSSGLPEFPGGVEGVVLLLLRVSVGVLFLQHGYPKFTHLQEWASSLKMPVFLCFLSAVSMLGGGLFLILGLLTLLACLPLLASMVFAAYLHIKQGKPFMARDPYQIPEGQYQGPLGKGEPPSWEKAFMYCIMLITIAVLGPGAYSLDALIFQ